MGKGESKEEKASFRKILITRCQVEFEKNKAAELDAEKWHKEINSCTDPVSVTFIMANLMTKRCYTVKYVYKLFKCVVNNNNDIRLF